MNEGRHLTKRDLLPLVGKGCYVGIRAKIGVCEAYRPDGNELDMRLDLCNHSPTGFEWGYGGSGPAQLALAILAYHLNDDENALSLYQSFKWKVVAGLPCAGWQLSPAHIDRAIKEANHK